MAREYTDEEVFGTAPRASVAPREYTDDEVFGAQPPAPAARDVGLMEGFGRGAKEMVSKGAKRAGLIMSAPAVLMDKATSALLGRNVTDLSDFMFRNLVDPAERNIQGARINPAVERLTGAGQAGAVAGNVAGMIPDLILGGMATAPLKAPAVTDPIARQVAQLFFTGMAGSQPVAQTQALGRRDDLAAQGVPDDVANAAALRSFGADTLTMPLPAAAPVGRAIGMLTGAGTNVAGNAIGLEASNALLRERGFPGATTDPYSAETVGPAAALGAIFGAMGGGRAPAPRQFQRPADLPPTTSAYGDLPEIPRVPGAGEVPPAPVQQPAPIPSLVPLDALAPEIVAQRVAEQLRMMGEPRADAPLPVLPQEVARAPMMDRPQGPVRYAPDVPPDVPVTRMLPKPEDVQILGERVEQTPMGQGVTTPTRRIIGRQEPAPGARMEPPEAPTAPLPPRQPPPDAPPAAPLSLDAPIRDSVGMPDDLRAELGRLKSEFGWAEWGGSMLRDQDGSVSGRTAWIPRAEWWRERPAGMSEPRAQAALQKILDGKPMGKREKAYADFLMSIAQRNLDDTRASLEAAKIGADEARAEAEGRMFDAPPEEFAASLRQRHPELSEMSLSRNPVTGGVEWEAWNIYPDLRGEGRGSAIAGEVMRYIAAQERGGVLSANGNHDPVNPVPVEALTRMYRRAAEESGMKVLREVRDDADPDIVHMTFGHDDTYARIEEEGMRVHADDVEDAAAAHAWLDDFLNNRLPEQPHGQGNRANNPEPAASQSVEGGAGVREQVRQGGETPERPGIPPAAERPDFGLEGQRPADLTPEAEAARAAEVAQREERAIADRERDVFSLQPDTPPAPEPSRSAQGGLFPGGTLSGGLIPKPVADAVARAFGGAVDALRKVDEAIKAPGGNIARRAARYIFDSASGNLRGFLRNTEHKSPTANWILDQFSTEAGALRATDENVMSAQQAQQNHFFTKLVKATEGLSDKEMEQAVAQVRSGAIAGDTPVGRAARQISDMLDEVLGYMREAGVELGEVRNYFPREFDMTAVMANSGKFIDALTQAYRETGLDPKVARESANELADTLMYGADSIFRPDSGNGPAPFLKGRKFGPQVDQPSHPLHQFLQRDPRDVLTRYIGRAVKRAEIARRFGDGFSHWNKPWTDADGVEHSSLRDRILDEGGGDSLRAVTDYITTVTGGKGHGMPTGGIRAASAVRTWVNLALLSKATLTSLTEPLMVGVRTGNMVDALRGVKDNFADLIPRLRSEDAKTRHAFAEDMGLLVDGMTADINAARWSGGDPVSKAESKLLHQYFQRTGLNQWTEGTTVAGAHAGQVYLRRLAKDVADGGKRARLSGKFLAELGVKDPAAFSAWLTGVNDGMPQGGDIKGAQGDAYRVAIRRFVSQTRMMPDATNRPAWASSPLGSVVFQLQSFNYAFFENVWKRNAKLAREAMKGDYTNAERMRLLMPMLTMPMIAAAGYAVGEARDALLGSTERREEETWELKAAKAFSRATPVAPIDPAMNWLAGARYQRGAAEAFAGVGPGNLARIADNLRDQFLRNSENTNTTERATAKLVWDYIVEPAANLALSVATRKSGVAVTLGAAAATQFLGSGDVRDEFATEVAGPKREKPPKGGGGGMGAEFGSDFRTEFADEFAD
jgi:hypothetical protein